MAFTTLAIIKKHLLDNAVPPLFVRNSKVVLSGEAETQLPHTNLVENSERVILPASAKLTRQAPVTLTGTDWIPLAHAPLVPGTMSVTQSDALSVVYHENTDFIADNELGKIRRVEGGAIPDNQTVIVFYQRAALFSRTADYQIDFAQGTVKRRDGGTIPDGAEVSLDYEVADGSVTESLIAQVIEDVQDKIVRSLASGYSAESTDHGLQVGATELALSVIARAMSAEQLGRRLISDAAGRAREWQKMAELYETNAWRTLRPFLDPYQIRSPEKSTDA